MLRGVCEVEHGLERSRDLCADVLEGKLRTSFFMLGTDSDFKERREAGSESEGVKSLRCAPRLQSEFGHDYDNPHCLEP